MSMTAYESVKKWRRAHPDRARAQQRVSNHIRRGLIRRPATCPVCRDSSRPIEAHHPDYSQPLLIAWSCRDCHMAVHRGTWTRPDVAARNRSRARSS